MAWRIEKSILRGEIDNRVRRQTRGRLWLVGRHEPLVFDLVGNCSRDLAGCILQFENPHAAVTKNEHTNLAALQTGVVGKMTASAKVRVPDVSPLEAIRRARAGEMVPAHVANALYLEWYSECNGRVVIESAGLRLTMSPPVWTLSVEEDQEQAALNRQAFERWKDRRADVTRHQGGFRREKQ